MSALDDLDELTEMCDDGRLARLQISYRNQAAQRRVVEAIEKIESSLTTLERYAESQWVLKEASTANQLRVNGVADSLREYATNLKSADSRDLYLQWSRQVESKLPTTTDSLSNTLREVWTSRCSKTRTLFASLGAVLEQINKPRVQECGRKMRDHVARIDALAGVFPPGQEERTELQTIEAAGETLRQDLGKLDLSEAVQVFLLRAADDEGAPLSSVTAEVQKWLETHAAGDGFTVRLQRDA